jgi:hypothetical protein
MKTAQQRLREWEFHHRDSGAGTMVRLGDVVPERAEGGVYDWERYSENQREQREASEPLTFSEIANVLVSQILETVISHTHFSLLSGDPLISIGISIVLLMILRSRVTFAVLVLLFALVANMNPLYVSLAYLLYGAYLSRFKKPKYRAVKLGAESKEASSASGDHRFDHILVGNDLSTYLAAALLARVGKRCCLVEPLNLPSQESLIQQGRPAIPLQPLTLFRPDRVHVCPSPFSLRPSSSRSAGYREYLAPFLYRLFCLPSAVHKTAIVMPF